jgi:hypothetical protein
MNAKELELSQQVLRETLMERFQGHRLLGLQCEAGKTDALCECGWMYAANSVGGAFDYWVEHLIWVGARRMGQQVTALLGKP